MHGVSRLESLFCKRLIFSELMLGLLHLSIHSLLMLFDLGVLVEQST